MKLSKTLPFVAGVALVALGTMAFVQIRREMKNTEESIRQMVREVAVEAGREAGKEAGKEVRAGLVEGMDHVGDRVEAMPGRIIDSAANEIGERFTGFANRMGGGNELPGRAVSYTHLTLPTNREV